MGNFCFQKTIALGILIELKLNSELSEHNSLTFNDLTFIR